LTWRNYRAIVGAMQNSLVPSFRFEEGILHILTGNKTAMLIHAWPRLEAMQKGVNEKSWRRFWPAFQLVTRIGGQRPLPVPDK
jgi:hypothetical protein